MTRFDVTVSANGGEDKKALTYIGRYEILRTIGKGNFARVDEAIHTDLKTKVAVKIIDTQRKSEDYVLKNLTREAKLLSMLKHPNIVRLYETIRYNSIYCLVTELATGGDMFTHIKSQPNGKLNETMTKHYSRQLIAALRHMHSRGVVHRDLKVENIMLKDGQKKHIKIIDFGLSNIYKKFEPLKTHCGSPEYAAPELFVSGRIYGPEVDLWSLGVIVYVMATGRLPFFCPPNGQMLLEERRRKLMTQINRGLTPEQEGNISRMSSGYRDLVSRLLIPTPPKRITIHEAYCHPWITNRSKDLSNVIMEKDFDIVKHKAIINDIAKITHLHRHEIEMELLQKKYGEIGGMYNIRIHESCRKLLQPTSKSTSISPSSLRMPRLFSPENTSMKKIMSSVTRVSQLGERERQNQIEKKVTKSVINNYARKSILANFQNNSSPMITKMSPIQEFKCTKTHLTVSSKNTSEISEWDVVSQQESTKSSNSGRRAFFATKAIETKNNKSSTFQKYRYDSNAFDKLKRERRFSCPMIIKDPSWKAQKINQTKPVK